MKVRACDGDRPGDVLEECKDGTTCNLGRCMTVECAAAWSTHRSFAGCFFYTAHAANVASEAAAPMSFLITNAGTAEANVSLQHIDGSAGWVLSGAAAVPPGESARLSILGKQVSEIGVSTGAALRLVSTLPVTIAQIESDDSNERALSTSGTMLLPAHVLGLHHRVLAYPQLSTPEIDALAGGAGGAARMLIVGTRPRTTVQFTAGPQGAVVVAPDPITMLPGETRPIMLGDGDVFQASSAGDTDDLSGSELWADRPVAVFSGNVSTAYGVVGAAGINSPDMAHEQIPPVGSWSYKYVAASLPPQAETCDTLLGRSGASVWRMVASAEGITTVDFTGAPGIVGLPTQLKLEAGVAQQLVVAGGDFTVKASGPLLLAQGMDCEPTLALAVSADVWLSDLRFAVLPNFDQLVAIVRPRGAPVVLDDMPLDDDLFVPAGGDQAMGYHEVARVQLGVCHPREQVCTHHLTGTFGMTLRGMDVFSSYALTAPMWSGCIDPADTTCVP
jgi:hypothetical protein